MYVCTYLCMYHVCMYICTYVFIYVCVCVCMYVRTYIFFRPCSHIALCKPVGLYYVNPDRCSCCCRCRNLYLVQRFNAAAEYKYSSCYCKSSVDVMCAPKYQLHCCRIDNPLPYYRPPAVITCCFFPHLTSHVPSNIWSVRNICACVSDLHSAISAVVISHIAVPYVF